MQRAAHEQQPQPERVKPDEKKQQNEQPKRDEKPPQ
jgi:hypothetical protein